MQELIDLGVVCGRFQVPELHLGHRSLIDWVRYNHRHVLIAISKPAVRHTKHDPMDVPTRVAMIQRAYPDAGIMIIDDCGTDVGWSKNFDTGITQFMEHNKLKTVQLVCSRDGFVPRYHGKLPTKILTHEDHHLINPQHNATAMREMIKRKPLTTADFRYGVIYAVQNQYDKCVPVVDIAVTASDQNYGTRVLLGRKPGETRTWRFPGGFVDPKDESMTAAALRELKEETCLERKLEDMRFIGNPKIEDWRYEFNDKLFTSFYHCDLDNHDFRTLGAKAGDDLQEVVWFRILPSLVESMVPTHKKLMTMFLLDYWTKKGKK